MQKTPNIKTDLHAQRYKTQRWSSAGKKLKVLRKVKGTNVEGKGNDCGICEEKNKNKGGTRSPTPESGVAPEELRVIIQT